MRAAIVLGTRPEIIKLAPVVHELRRRNHEAIVIDTGQHSAPGMTDCFFESMKYMPNYRLTNFSMDETPDKIVSILSAINPDILIVQGDTDSTLAGALAGASVKMDVAHVEAGLRSWDLGMREERNRIMVDAMSEFKFAPTAEAVRYLTGSSYIVGNTIADVLDEQCARWEAKKHILLTLHRREAVDNIDTLATILIGVLDVAKLLGLPVVFPIHPRTQQKLDQFNIPVPMRINTCAPRTFEDFLELEEGAALILTDSGGVQEEACILGVPCVTLRNNTERPETIGIGANMLAGYTPDSIVKCAKEMMQPRAWQHPYGSNVAEQIVSILEVGNHE